MADKLESTALGGRRSPPPVNKGTVPGATNTKTLKNPAELVAHYTAKGLDEKAAHEKVIEDLQEALAFSFQSYPMQKMMMMDKQLKTSIDSFTQVIEQKVSFRVLWHCLCCLMNLWLTLRRIRR